MKNEPVRIMVPNELNMDSAIEFSRYILSLSGSSSYVFDFSELNFVEPTSMLIVASSLERFRADNDESEFIAENYYKNTYAGHMGFFRAFGIDFGNDPGQAKGSTSYLPITILDVNEVISAARENRRPVGEELEDRARNLSEVLTQNENGSLVDTLTFSIREIMRNVIEHSESSLLEYCAQYWPTRNSVEIGILDKGIGVSASLSRNPYVNIESDAHALQLSLMPGVSGKMYKGVRQRAYDDWQNSGFGLYMTNRICRNGGSFFIASGTAGLMLTDSDKYDYNTGLDGTILRMILNTEALPKLTDSLSRFNKEGMKVAKEMGSTEHISASAASRMLSTDFS